MIRKQYDHYTSGRPNYFKNFVDSLTVSYHPELREEIRKGLAPYKATVAKSKAQYRYNIKFNDPKLYSLFVLRWS